MYRTATALFNELTVVIVGCTPADRCQTSVHNHILTQHKIPTAWINITSNSIFIFSGKNVFIFSNGFMFNISVVYKTNLVFFLLFYVIMYNLHSKQNNYNTNT